MTSNHYDTGPAKPHVNTGPRAASSTNSFARSLRVGSTDKKETAYSTPPKGQGSNLDSFTASQPPLTLLTAPKDRLTQLEEEMDTYLEDVADELKSETGLLESFLTDLHNIADKHLNTDISSLSDDLVALQRHVLKL